MQNFTSKNRPSNVSIRPESYSAGELRARADVAAGGHDVAVRCAHLLLVSQSKNIAYVVGYCDAVGVNVPLPMPESEH